MKVGNNIGGPVFSAPAAGKSNKEDSRIKNIEKQISDAQERLKSIGGNKDMPAEEKMQMRKELQQQIQDLKKQLNSRKIEIRKEEQEKIARKAREQAEKNAAKNRTGAEGGNISNWNSLLRADSSMKQVDSIHATKTQLNGKAGVLESEIKLDTTRGASTEAKEAELSDTKDAIQNAESAIGNEISKINKDLKKAGEETKETKKKDKEEKQEEIREENKVVNGERKETRQPSGEEASKVRESSAGTRETGAPIDLKL